MDPQSNTATSPYYDALSSAAATVGGFFTETLCMGTAFHASVSAAGRYTNDLTDWASDDDHATIQSITAGAVAALTALSALSNYRNYKTNNALNAKSIVQVSGKALAAAASVAYAVALNVYRDSDSSYGFGALAAGLSLVSLGNVAMHYRQMQVAKQAAQEKKAE
ncbi:MAG: hypothetical protein WCF65_07390 [Parachlamydiaceae bacterium]